MAKPGQQATANGLPASSSLISVGASPTGMIAVGYDDNDNDIAFESGDGKMWSDAPSTAQLLGSSDVEFANGGDGLLGIRHRANRRRRPDRGLADGGHWRLAAAGDDRRRGPNGRIRPKGLAGGE